MKIIFKKPFLGYKEGEIAETDEFGWLFNRTKNDARIMPKDVPTLIESGICEVKESPTLKFKDKDWGIEPDMEKLNWLIEHTESIKEVISKHETNKQ